MPTVKQVQSTLRTDRRNRGKSLARTEENMDINMFRILGKEDKRTQGMADSRHLGSYHQKETSEGKDQAGTESTTETRPSSTPWSLTVK